LRELPAAIPAAPAAAIAAVAVPASATASATATTAASTPSAPASAEAATTAPAASATTAFTRGPGFVDDNIAAHEIVAVQSLDGALGFLVAIDLDKSEPAWLPRETVAHQGNIRRGDSRLRE
jgi:beta-lactamase class A